MLDFRTNGNRAPFIYRKAAMSGGAVNCVREQRGGIDGL
jgi:hypothetical protein